MSPGLTIVSGNGQATAQYYNTTSPLVVQAGDSAGKPVAGLVLTWTVTAGAGTLVGAMAQTDANGQATAYFRGDVTPGYSYTQQTVTVSSSLGTVNFVETTTINSLPNGATAAPPLVQLTAPAAENRNVRGAAGSTLKGAVAINVTVVSGSQQGLPIPNIGMRIIDAYNPSATPVARCATPVLTDASGNAACDLLVTGSPGTYGLSAEVGEFVSTPVFFLTITSAPTCTFTISPTNPQLSSAGGLVTIVVTTADGCGWTAVSNSSWITINSGASGTGYGGAVLSVDPNSGAARTGSATVAGQTVTVTQSAAGSSGGSLSIVTTTLPTAVVGAAYTATFTATGGTAPYRWSTPSAMPSGLTLNPTTGGISGTPLTAGTYTLPMTLTDAVGTTQNRAFTLSVVTSNGHTPPSITNTSFPGGTVGIPYQELLTSVGSCASVFSAPPVYTLSSGTLPPGLQVLAIDQTRYAIAGTPTQTGAFAFAITVTDACGGSSSASFSITIAGSSNPGSLTITPSSLTYYVVAGSNPADQTVSIAGPAGATFTATASSGGGWLSIVGAASGSLPATLTVRASTPGGFPTGTYTGGITLNTTAGVATISVTVTTSGPAAVLVPSIAAVGASVQQGSSAITQTITITNATGPATFTVLPSIVNGSGWLSVTPTTGTTPTALTVTLNPTGLAPSTYLGAIQLVPSSPSGAPVTLKVTFQVLLPAGITSSLSSMSFASSAEQPGAASQTLNIGSTGLPFDATVTATTSSGANWLSVTPSRATTPLQAVVSVNTTGLAAGAYQGSIIIASGTQSIAPVTIPVTLTVTLPAPVLAAIRNAASYAGGGVSPGEIVTIFGSGMGPGALVTSTVTSRGTVDTTAGGTIVTFDGVAAPVLYSRADQLSVIVPYSVDGKASTQVQIGYRGALSTAFTVPVAPSAPGLFTMTASGIGAAAALNQDGSYNTPTSGAAPGSIVVLYATGEGQTSPGGSDGLLAASVYPKPLLPVTVTIGGVTAEVLYAGAAPTYSAGLMQVNVRVPGSAPRGASVPVVLTVGAASSQSGVTIYTQP
ncbi:MAG: putative Ig domain-containing protein [Acidobacteria bacterium]|nr:putative Ig domain-containing protein [Acidobacteriota bacterium]